MNRCEGPASLAERPKLRRPNSMHFIAALTKSVLEKRGTWNIYSISAYRLWRVHVSSIRLGGGV